MTTSNDNVVSVRFGETQHARQGLRILEAYDVAGQIDLRGAIVVERTQDGGIRLPTDTEMVAGVTTGGGSLIGLLMGILGGPLGMLLGWRGAAMLGAAVDMRIAERSGAIGHLSATVRIGTAALVADITETDVALVDAAMADLGGQVIRRPADVVLAELAAAEEASKAAELEALRVLREQHKAERREEREAQVADLRRKLRYP